MFFRLIFELDWISSTNELLLSKTFSSSWFYFSLYMQMEHSQCHQMTNKSPSLLFLLPFLAPSALLPASLPISPFHSLFGNILLADQKKRTSIKWTVNFCWRNYIRYMKTFSQVMRHKWFVFSSVVLNPLFNGFHFAKVWGII